MRIITPVECYIAAIDIFNKKREYSYERRSYPVYFNTPFLIIYLSAIVTLICHTEIVVNPFAHNDTF